MVKFEATKEQIEIIVKICSRADRMLLPGPRVTRIMDFEAVLSNDRDIDLEGLLGASDQDFIHDVLGISMHINRKTGRLEDCFVPRFACKTK